MQKPTDHDALLAMKKFGGGFASSLAVAWLRADSDNRKRLQDAFGDLLEDYREIAMIRTTADDQPRGAA